MKVLGIDTSLRSTGYGVLSAEGSRLRMVECGAIRKRWRLPLTAPEAIHERVAALIAAHAPDVMASSRDLRRRGTIARVGRRRAEPGLSAAARPARVYEYDRGG